MKAEPNSRGTRDAPSWSASLSLVAVLVLPLVATAALPVLGAPLVTARAGGPSSVAAETPPGQRLFLAEKCNTCHAIEALGIEAKTKSETLRGPDLSTVGSRHSAGELAAYLARETTIGGEKHKKEFKGSDEELQALARWLATLEEP